MTKIIAEAKMQELKNQRKVKESNNESNIVGKDTEVLIVGTLTPRDYPWFYTSPDNPMYKYIDNARHTNLEQLKQEEKYDSIKKELIKQKIAFLDVYKEAIMREGFEDSSLDRNIESATLDVKSFLDAFKKIENVDKLKIIVNSRQAERHFEMLINRIDFDEKTKENIENKKHYCAQHSRRKTREELKEAWREILNSDVQ